MIVAGTGHRPNKLGGYNNESFLKLVEVAENWIRENNPTKVISGMAQGWDQALAQAAINCGVPFVAAIPFKGQETRWSIKGQKYYTKLLTKADSIIYVSGEGYAPYKMQLRNKWMVDNSDIVLAMWDGTGGGTFNCVNYAQAREKEIVNLFTQLNEILL